jgi:hypothetical protein
MHDHDSRLDRRHDPRLDRALRICLTWGTLAVLMLPFARGYSSAIGWMPLWLIAMPASAWWALHRFALPSWPRAQANPTRRRRRRLPQAQRRATRMSAPSVSRRPQAGIAH